MRKLTKSRIKKTGLPPGTLVHTGERKRETALVTSFEYNENCFKETEIKDTAKGFFPDHTSETIWINVDGIHQIEILEKLGGHFRLHPLVLEDILNTDQRPKFENFDSYIYIVAKMVYCSSHSDDIVIEQVSLILGKGYVISFQEKGEDVFNPVRERLRKNIGLMRKMGADYLAYSLLDAIVDNYFVILEKLGEKIDLIEDALVVTPTSKVLQEIQNLKREMLFLHKSIWPLREVIAALERRESLLVQDSTIIYLRDVYDHIIQVMDTIETFREILSSMLDIYLSSISNRMNEVMKVLTIFSALFMPLTFLAGIYGMNFKYIPELEWRWGYPAVLIVMAGSVLLMLNYFKRKKWM